MSEAAIVPKTFLSAGWSNSVDNGLYLVLVSNKYPGLQLKKVKVVNLYRASS